ncbi:DUF1007 family protein [Nisaea acidiphila]|uniref:DUF1007 family protein n=1 Tax=Nisaea acidiphila TaxID=1862145 RepID=A0A9J7AQN1_9PROT|nr:DUF1007 family protein [Nisaea acidiphila]UUX48905.1 DUF1007 family protein [Nisaea acidiphila]
MITKNRSYGTSILRSGWFFGIFAFGLALLVSARTAESHPHAWVDITVQVIFDPAGDVAGLREHWLLDEFYTVFALESMGAGDAGPTQAAIDDLMKNNMKSLAEYDYFTQVEQAGKPIAFGPITKMASQLKNGRLLMSFMLPFKQAVNLSDGPLDYRIFDPTYYIEVLHAQQDDAIQLQGAPVGCNHRLTAPRPSLEDIARAARLDQTQSGGDGLGILFSERVEVYCP